jgi:hypothetical protein
MRQMEQDKSNNEQNVTNRMRLAKICVSLNGENLALTVQDLNGTRQKD